MPVSCLARPHMTPGSYAGVLLGLGTHMTPGSYAGVLLGLGTHMAPGSYGSYAVVLLG